MADQTRKWLGWISKLQAIAQNGLNYTKDPFDKERFTTILEISAEIAANHSRIEHQKILEWFSIEMGYATPKLDARGAVFENNKVLLVKERSDNLWTLPGGWVEVNESPSEAIGREVFEESGYEVSVIKLIGLYDTNKHERQSQWPHVYKCFFLCDLIGGSPKINLEICDIDFFAENELPELSTRRTNKTQILRCFEHFRDSSLSADFD